MINYSIADIEFMAKRYHNSGLLQGANLDTIFVLMMSSLARGIDPALVCDRYYIAMGKPYIKTEAIFSDFVAANGKVNWLENSDKAAEAVFYYQGQEIRTRITIEDARRTGKANSAIWKAYPKRMLMKSVVRDSIMALCPNLSLNVEEDETGRPQPKKAAIKATVEQPVRAEDNAGTIPTSPEEKKDPEREGKIALVRELMKSVFSCATKADFIQVASNFGNTTAQTVEDFTDEELANIVKFCEDKENAEAANNEAEETEAEIVEEVTIL